MITATNLGKKYVIRHNAGVSPTYRRFSEDLVEAAKKPIRLLKRRSTPKVVKEEFWALHDVDFRVEEGEVLGIIGRNGAGKSTLLKLLSRITEPTTGRIELEGRIASLLEVGTGFHPELTGRENIFLNGAILGMSRSEIRQKFDEIVAFAEIEKFLDTPVKRYSSGMFVRLAFAVAAHLEPEILVVDEVLAVGDAEFQKKCLGKMQDVAEGGRTVLFVSHNMAVIQRLCTRCLFLNDGTIVQDGPVSDVVAQYFAIGQSSDLGRFVTRQRGGSGWARIKEFRLISEDGSSVPFVHSDENLTFEAEIEVQGEASSQPSLNGLVIELMFFNEHGQPLTSVMSVDDPGIEMPKSGQCRVRATIQGPVLVPGRYRIDLFLGVPFLQHVDEIPEAFWFEILPPKEPWRPYPLNSIRGDMCRSAKWSVLR